MAGKKKDQDMMQNQDEDMGHQDEFYEKLNEEGSKGGQAVKDQMRNKDMGDGETSNQDMSEYDEEP